MDSLVFRAIKSGKKTVETRGGGKYDEIKKGDMAYFICGRGRLKKRIKKVQKFSSIKTMLRKINFRKIWPHLKNPSLKEIEKTYYAYPGYRGRIKKHGLVAFWI